MASAYISVLIVEDDDAVRTSLEEIFAALGYQVRSTVEGLAALAEIRKEVPDILLSDLCMPGMSGFELLSVVRRRFPEIHVVAMSGMFTEEKIPCGVAADALYQKGNGVAALLGAIESRHLAKRETRRTPAALWIQRNGHDAKGAEFVTIGCPECCRTFPQATEGSAGLILEIQCVFCKCTISYAIVNPNSWGFPRQEAARPHLAAAESPTVQFSDAPERERETYAKA
ncbi:MAG TPA: response regulator [Terracidiphilus sp.]|jgi:CheY-like chemotaxis protein